MTFAVEHPLFGTVTFVFDDELANSGFAQTDGFTFLGVDYPKIAFGFEREGSAFVSCELNNRTSQIFNGHLLTISKLAPSAFRSFVLSKARELANKMQRQSHGNAADR
jgi:hypothetical protein